MYERFLATLKPRYLVVGDLSERFGQGEARRVLDRAVSQQRKEEVLAVGNADGFVEAPERREDQASGPHVTRGQEEPPGVTGVTYGAQWSTNLDDWFDITDTGSGNHLFRVAVSGHNILFIRHVIVQSP